MFTVILFTFKDIQSERLLKMFKFIQVDFRLHKQKTNWFFNWITQKLVLFINGSKVVGVFFYYLTVIHHFIIMIIHTFFCFFKNSNQISKLVHLLSRQCCGLSSVKQFDGFSHFNFYELLTIFLFLFFFV